MKTFFPLGVMYLLISGIAQLGYAQSVDGLDNNGKGGQTVPAHTHNSFEEETNIVSREQGQIANIEQRLDDNREVLGNRKETVDMTSIRACGVSTNNGTTWQTTVSLLLNVIILMLLAGGGLWAFKQSELIENIRNLLIQVLNRIPPTSNDSFSREKNPSPNLDEVRRELKKISETLLELLRSQDTGRDQPAPPVDEGIVVSDPEPPVNPITTIAYFEEQPQFGELQNELLNWLRSDSTIVKQAAILVFSSLERIAVWLQSSDQTKERIGKDSLWQALWDVSSALTLASDANGEAPLTSHNRLEKWQNFLGIYSDRGRLFTLDLPSLGSSIDPLNMISGRANAAQISKVLRWGVLSGGKLVKRPEVR